MGNLEKVIFDTNTIRNIESNKFLGGRDELNKFFKLSEIIFPDIVIEEIKYQKRKNLEKHKQSFLDNPFHWIRSINKEETESFDNENHINELEKNEEIKYSIIKLTDYSVLEKIKDLALKKLPPFEDGDNTDKGFKDAYIYFTILEYLQIIPDKYVFVCTKDGKLKDALKKHENIKVIKDFEEFREISNTYFYEDYFIEKLKNDISSDIKKDNIVDYFININENQVLLIEVNDDELLVEIDSREIIFTVNKKTFFNHIEKLINSDSFSKTFSTVRFLKGYINYFNDNEIIRMFEAIFNNRQIRGAFHNSVKEFYFGLYENKKEIFNQELKEKIEKLFS